MRKSEPNWTVILGIASCIILVGLVIAELIIYVQYWGTPFNELPGWVQWWLWFTR